MSKFRVSFQPEGRTITVRDGQILLDAARAAGIHLNAPCGGMGVCGNCRVILSQGTSEPTPAEREILRAEELESGVRLACKVRVKSDLVVLVPDETRLADQKILSSGIGRTVELDPSVRKHHLELPEPSIENHRTDLERLQHALHGDISSTTKAPGVGVALDLIRTLPESLRSGNFEVTAVTADDRLIAVEPGRTDDRSFGIAFDIGTTTVVGMLINLATGEELAVVGRTNPQTSYGDDVVSRIQFADEKADGLSTLQSLIIACMNEIIDQACAEAKVSASNVYEVTAVGNTTMLHLLLGVSPTNIARAPYVGAFRAAGPLRADELGLHVNPAGRVCILPVIAGFVGADTVAVILAGDMERDEKIRLAVDIGTNGELVIGSSKRLICCSTAAGPAFEGARIKFGMRAATGAIDAVDIIDGKVKLHLISGDTPAGICGTGLLDAVAELLRVGIIDETGRILPADELPNLPEPLKARIHNINGGNDFVLAEHSTGDDPIYLTQRDVRELQLAKGAIVAGMEIMKKELGISDNDIDEVLLAGAFGNYIRRESAVAVGLFAKELLGRIRFIGNAAGVGARLALINRDCRRQAMDISRRVEYIELAGRSDFQMIFAEAMMFPTPEITT